MQNTMDHHFFFQVSGVDVWLHKPSRVLFSIPARFTVYICDYMSSQLVVKYGKIRIQFQISISEMLNIPSIATLLGIMSTKQHCTFGFLCCIYTSSVVRSLPFDGQSLTLVQKIQSEWFPSSELNVRPLNYSIENCFSLQKMQFQMLWVFCSYLQFSTGTLCIFLLFKLHFY